MNASRTLMTMADEALERFPSLQAFTAERRRTIVRRIRYCAIDHWQLRQRNERVIRDSCLTKIQAAADFADIVDEIGLADLTNLCEWIVGQVCQWPEGAK